MWAELRECGAEGLEVKGLGIDEDDDVFEGRVEGLKSAGDLKAGGIKAGGTPGAAG